jgi:type III restriction enzyme
MSDAFFEKPILNSPYEYPSRHWELDETGQPTQRIIESRRKVDLVTPIPKARKRTKASEQAEMVFDEGEGLSSISQSYETAVVINELRGYVDEWRKLSNPNDWLVSPETARLLRHWRSYEFTGPRPFFCQVEAVEVAIWLTEVAPKFGEKGKKFLEHLENASRDANPEILRLALKLATGAGKTTVMAMLIAWQTINAVRQPNSKKFTKGFLIVTPGITIRDRLRVLKPNDPDSIYIKFELVPQDLLHEMDKAKIVITNYHAFMLRERMTLSKGNRRLLQGQRGEEIKTTETEGQMIQRVMPELMGMKNILVINDEAHHCYREKPPEEDESTGLKGDEKKEADENNEAARVWISGIEAVKRKLGVNTVIDLSATPFFLSGSGYAEGTLFPWTMSDFSLMDAIECGIVKLPRVPIADNIPNNEMPMYRDLWKHIGKKMPKKNRAASEHLDPASLPPQLQTALEALYGHYEKTYELWKQEGVRVPPCFIVVCNNTATSKLVYDYISGYRYEDADGNVKSHPGHLELFKNYNEHGEPVGKPNTLLIDSVQLESGEAIDDNFRKIAQTEIELFRREIVERKGDVRAGDKITDEQVLREVMNTVGKEGRLGGQIRCVVSVSMLTEGWDANTVTHVLGVRAFGTQLLCEQVVGRALRRQSYELNEEGHFNVEYADVLGIPFDFTAKPVTSKPQEPRETIHVHAMKPERDELEIEFPRVIGYRVEPPRDRVEASFTDDSTLELTPELIGATETRNSGIIGMSADLTLEHTGDVRESQVVYELAGHILFFKWRDVDGNAYVTHFDDIRRICRQWIRNHLVCKGGTYPAQLRYRTIADIAGERIVAGITRAHQGESQIKALVDPYNPTGSTRYVSFNSSKRTRWETTNNGQPKNHVNWVITDSDWEAEFCRVVESHPKVIAYTKNHSLGFEVPYRFEAESRRYRPDFIVLLDDGKGAEDPLKLIVEIKGYRGEDAKEKASTMETYWVPGVNNLKKYGRWAFKELTDYYGMSDDFEKKIEALLEEAMEGSVAEEPK